MNEVERLIHSYGQQHGLDTSRDTFTKLDPQRHRMIADAFHAMKDEPHNPLVLASYNAAKPHLEAQYEHALRHGFRFSPWLHEGQPYANSNEMMDDVLGNKHLHFFLTDNGFGSADSSSHPLLSQSPYEVAGHRLLHNDVLRAVHDLYGHAAYGHQFGPIGEDRAWHAHLQMFPKEAHAALTNETRMQNAWVNFGPHLRRPDGSLPVKGDHDWVHPADRPYADQKVGVVPEWVMTPNWKTGVSKSVEGDEGDGGLPTRQRHGPAPRPSGGGRRIIIVKAGHFSTPLSDLKHGLKSGFDHYQYADRLNDFREEQGKDPVDDPEEHIIGMGDKEKDQFQSWLEHGGASPDDLYGYYAPPSQTLDYKRVDKPGWSVHFTDDPNDIQRQGFIYGHPDYEGVHLTTHKRSRQERPGYNFAYRAGDPRARRTASTGGYGRHAVVFPSGGVSAYHAGDEEDQHIFHGPAVDPMHAHPIMNMGGGEWAVHDAAGRHRFSGPFEDAVQHVIDNHEQLGRAKVKAWGGGLMPGVKGGTFATYRPPELWSVPRRTPLLPKAVSAERGGGGIDFDGIDALRGFAHLAEAPGEGMFLPGIHPKASLHAARIANEMGNPSVDDVAAMADFMDRWQWKMNGMTPSGEPNSPDYKTAARMPMTAWFNHHERLGNIGPFGQAANVGPRLTPEELHSSRAKAMDEDLPRINGGRFIPGIGPNASGLARIIVDNHKPELGMYGIAPHPGGPLRYDKPGDMEKFAASWPTALRTLHGRHPDVENAASMPNLAWHQYHEASLPRLAGTTTQKALSGPAVHPWEEKAKAHFGLTSDPAMGGFVFRDGTRLKMGGDSYRDIPHSRIRIVLGKDADEDGYAVEQFMHATGAVRYGRTPFGSAIHIQSIHPMTEAQKAALSLSVKPGDSIHAEVTDPEAWHKQIHAESATPMLRYETRQLLDRMSAAADRGHAVKAIVIVRSGALAKAVPPGAGVPQASTPSGHLTGSDYFVKHGVLRNDFHLHPGAHLVLGSSLDKDRIPNHFTSPDFGPEYPRFVVRGPSGMPDKDKASKVAYSFDIHPGQRLPSSGDELDQMVDSGNATAYRHAHVGEAFEQADRRAKLYGPVEYDLERGRKNRDLDIDGVRTRFHPKSLGDHDPLTYREEGPHIPHGDRLGVHLAHSTHHDVEGYPVTNIEGIYHHQSHNARFIGPAEKLAFRRAVQKAAEAGHIAVTWSPGDVHFGREPFHPDYSDMHQGQYRQAWGHIEKGPDEDGIDDRLHSPGHLGEYANEYARELHGDRPGLPRVEATRISGTGGPGHHPHAALRLMISPRMRDRILGEGIPYPAGTLSDQEPEKLVSRPMRSRVRKAADVVLRGHEGRFAPVEKGLDARAPAAQSAYKFAVKHIGDMDGQCLEASALMAHHLRGQGFPDARAIRRVLPSGDGHWTVRFSGHEYDPTVAHWASDRPDGVGEKSLHHVVKGSPVLRWPEDKLARHADAVEIARNEYPEAFAPARKTANGVLKGHRTAPQYAIAIRMARKRVDPDPTPAQAEAGNYPKGHFHWRSMDISIEVAKGTRRKKGGLHGKPAWTSPPMPCDYGQFVGEKPGKDGDPVDVFIGPNLESEIVYVINQVDAKGQFDEHKVAIGFPSLQAAKAAYLGSYSPGWKCGEVTAMTLDHFKAWLKDGDRSVAATTPRPA